MYTRIFTRSSIAYGLCAVLISVGVCMGVTGGAIYAAPSENSPEARGAERDALNQEEIPERAPDPAAEGSTNFLIDKYINPAIVFLSAIVGLVTVISIVVGGIQYASSGDDPQKVSKAKSRIFNSILGLLAWLFLSAFLEWLVPGGFL